MKNLLPSNLGVVRVSATGNWAEALKVFKDLGPGIKVAAIEAQSQVALVVLKKVQNHLIKQDLGWRKLNPRYQSQKAAQGLDTRILLARWTYFKNIKYWTNRGGWKVYVGVKPGVYTRTLSGERSTLDVARIAAIHEFSRGKRRRPLWNPTFKELGGKSGLKTLFIKNLHTQLRRQKLGKYIKLVKLR